MKGARAFPGAAAAILMVILILDSKTAIESARQGVQMCLTTLIPSLFPFMVLSGILTASLSGSFAVFLRPLGKLCGIPEGCEALLLTSWLGGYPVGAQCVYQGFSDGQLDRISAQRLLGFCNNAGPAFIFGMTMTAFDSGVIGWSLWGIQILSSLVTGLLLPGKKAGACRMPSNGKVDISRFIVQGVRSMAVICGWVVAARILIGFLDRWFLWMLPTEAAVIIQGALELSNGCFALKQIPSEGLRFILYSGFLSFGGLCIWMQTRSVTGELKNNQFILGKLLQTLVSLVISSILCPLLYPQVGGDYFPLVGAAVLFTLILKKVVAKERKVLYNV